MKSIILPLIIAACLILIGAILTPTGFTIISTFEEPQILTTPFATSPYTFHLPNTTTNYPKPLKIAIQGNTEKIYGPNEEPLSQSHWGSVSISGTPCRWLSGTSDGGYGAKGVKGYSTYICDEPSNNAIVRVTFPFGANREDGEIDVRVYGGTGYGWGLFMFIAGIGGIVLGVLIVVITFVLKYDEIVKYCG